MRKALLFILFCIAIYMNGCDLFASTIVAMNIEAAQESANVKKTEIILKNIKTTILQYRLEFNTLPNSLQDLIDTPNGRPLLEKEALLDSWGQPLQYEKNSNKIIITSIGADGKPSTEDDIYIDYLY
ncbi:MAG: type II secretion system protein GspG [Proteobacteria bacterium]|nr:type II secretion system protein GspG [Pseudomonadota bacterium]